MCKGPVGKGRERPWCEWGAEGRSEWLDRKEKVTGERRRQGWSGAPTVWVHGYDHVVECVCVCVSGVAHRQMCLFVGPCMCVCTGPGMRLCAGPRTCVGMCKCVHVPVCSYLWHAGNRGHTTYRGPQREASEVHERG